MPPLADKLRLSNQPACAATAIVTTGHELLAEDHLRMCGVAALPHERHCLFGGDLLIALVEIRRGVPVASVLLDSYRDRREYLRELEERPPGDLREVVNRYPTQQLTDSVDLRCTSRVPAALLQLGFLGHPWATRRRCSWSNASP